MSVLDLTRPYRHLLILISFLKPLFSYINYFLSLFFQQDADRASISLKVIDDMILHVRGVCECAFDAYSLSPVQFECHNDTFLVSTDITLPDNRQYPKFITYLANWLVTVPHITWDNSGKTVTLDVNDFETTPLMHSSTSGSGEGSGESSGTEISTEPSIGEKELY